MIVSFRNALNTLEKMKSKGVRLDVDGDTNDDNACLYTEDATIAAEFEMVEEDDEYGFIK